MTSHDHFTTSPWTFTTSWWVPMRSRQLLMRWSRSRDETSTLSHELLLKCPFLCSLSCFFFVCVAVLRFTFCFVLLCVPVVSWDTVAVVLLPVRFTFPFLFPHRVALALNVFIGAAGGRRTCRNLAFVLACDNLDYFPSKIILESFIVSHGSQS